MTIQNDDTVKATVTGASSQAAVKRPGIFSSIGRFLREVHSELKKTNWPSKDELMKFTIVVLITIVAVAGFLAAADLIFGQIASQLFRTGAR